MKKSNIKFNRAIGTLLACFVTATLLVTACAPQSQREMSSVEKSYDSAGMTPEAPVMNMVQESESFGGGSYSASAAPIESNRMVIKNANLSIVVLDPPQSYKIISKMAEEMGGFVVTANIYQSYTDAGIEVPRASITIRIPAEKLEEAIETIEKQSDRLPINKTIDSQDVTSEYTDLASRLRNLEEAEEQLQKIMDDAFSTEDVLSVYNQLVSVREQIEMIKGQMKYYEQSAALSAVSVELIANEAVQPLTIGGWQPVGVARDALQSLVNTLKFLANAVIWIVIFFLPVIVLLYVIFFLPLGLLFKAIRRRRASKKATITPPVNPEIKE